MLNRATQKTSTLPSALPQFSHIKRYVDKTDGTDGVAKILPGEYYVTQSNEMITTVLGSCIAVCAYDLKLKIGGMNHFMLPLDSQSGSINSADVTKCTRYGNYAMELMINDILTLGGRRSKLEFKVFGGAKLMKHGSNIGAQNIHFVRSFLENEGYSISSSDVGITYPRKVKFFPETGKAKVRRLPSSDVEEIIHQEENLNTQSEPTLDDHGDLELF